RLTFADIAVWTLLNILVDSTGKPRDPIVESLAPVAALLQTIFLIASVICFVGAVVAVSLRFRRGDSVQREQVKWLVAGVAIVAHLLSLAPLLSTYAPA